jgi:hypothetical protein
MTKDEVLAEAKLVLANKTDSYVRAARLFAIYLLSTNKENSERPTERELRVAAVTSESDLLIAADLDED